MAFANVYRHISAHLAKILRKRYLARVFLGLDGVILCRWRFRFRSGGGVFLGTDTLFGGEKCDLLDGGPVAAVWGFDRITWKTHSRITWEEPGIYFSV
jgi:hypothetical protein